MASAGHPMDPAGSGGSYPQPPKIVVTCNPVDTITRADSISCSAAAEPSYLSLTDEKWSFTPDGWNVINGPTGTTGWGGKVIRAGQFTVTGRVNGVAGISAVKRIAVRPRTGSAWTWRGRARNDSALGNSTCYNGTQLGYEPHPDSTPAGYTVRRDSDCSAPTWIIQPHFGNGEGGFPVRSGTGPGQGIYYVVGVTDSMNVASQIHPDIRNDLVQ
jgi:hypothetical protein